MGPHIQFCEPKHDVLPFIGEFWNTFSNVPYLVVAILHARQQQSLAVATAAVGLGSMFFHATQLRGAEYVDEGAMLWLSLGLLQHTLSPLEWGVAVWGTCGTTLLYLGTENYLWFMSTFGALILLLAATVPSRAARLTMLTAAVCWCIERMYCAQSPTLFVCHGLWHVASAYSVHYVLVYIKGGASSADSDGGLRRAPQETTPPARDPGERSHEVDRKKVEALGGTRSGICHL